MQKYGEGKEGCEDSRETAAVPKVGMQALPAGLKCLAFRPGH